jgi:hypothetical protein
MTGRRWALLLLGVGGVVWALGGEWINIRHGIQENHFLDALVGLSYFAAGIVALDRRPGNVIGKLMIAYAATWFLANWGNLAVPVLPMLGLIANDTGTAFLGHIALAYPSGHVRARFDRFVLATIYAALFGTALVIFLTFAPRAFGCTACEWEPALFASRTVFRGAQTVNERAGVVLTPLFFAAIVLRWRRASRAELRDLAPLWVAVSLLALNFLLASLANPNYSGDPFAYLLWELRGLLEITVPCVFLWGCCRRDSRGAPSAIWWWSSSDRYRRAACGTRSRTRSATHRWASRTRSKGTTAGSMQRADRCRSGRGRPAPMAAWSRSSSPTEDGSRSSSAIRPSTKVSCAPLARRLGWRSRTSDCVHRCERSSKR